MVAASTCFVANTIGKRINPDHICSHPVSDRVLLHRAVVMSVGPEH